MFKLSPVILEALAPVFSPGDACTLGVHVRV